MSTWYFTFGNNQIHDGHYVKIEGTFNSARAEMIRRYGIAWAFQYSEQEWLAMRDDPRRTWPMETELKEG